jgi:hypothetical protein
LLQHAAFSVGLQHVCCTLAVQHAGPVEVGRAIIDCGVEFVMS